MKKLHIIASPRGERSKSIMLGEYAESLIPGETEHLDLFNVNVPFLTNGIISYNYGYMKYEDLSETDKGIANLQERFIHSLLNTEVLILSVPTWNFAMPGILKTWFDLIIKVNQTFKVENGQYIGLLKNIKKTIVVGSRGLNYTGSMAESDHLTKHITLLLNFIGIENIEIFWLEGVNVQSQEEIDRREEEIKSKMEKYATI